MILTTEVIPLVLKVPFKIAHGTSTTRHNVFIHIQNEAGDNGVGEAAVVPYYGETPERVQQAVAMDWQRLSGMFHDPGTALAQLPPAASRAARAGLDIVLHDLWGKQQGKPLYELWELDPTAVPQNSFTIAMTEGDYHQHIEQHADYPFLKLKLGSGDIQQDLTMVQTARQTLPEHRLCVDANSGWSVEDTLSMLDKLAPYDLEFIEQPVKTMDEWRTLAQYPRDTLFIADESVQGIETVDDLAGLVDGINIKLAKCGGLLAARQMIDLARQHKMRVMLGCMVESSVAITAAAHLAPLADYLDLDGNLLIQNDPYVGVTTQLGTLTLPDGAGLGVTRHAE
jgi:L-alanine-DL-glutamate epimerase-like enolase superfamily enzyme